jgi:hypothetical protein
MGLLESRPTMSVTKTMTSDTTLKHWNSLAMLPLPLMLHVEAYLLHPPNKRLHIGRPDEQQNPESRAVPGFPSNQRGAIETAPYRQIKKGSRHSSLSLTPCDTDFASFNSLFR